ncbi:hypothetical protein [Streptomyces sp. NPDC088258]|uniref:hypothetical protein n=1 Tax=Streptomyces sp. NPDC088258 TaxID=3365849 RepID=UPI00381173F7
MNSDRTRRWFSSARIALLPLGKRWSAAEAPEREGLAAAAEVPGPVIHDPAGRSLYFLVPVGIDWDAIGETERLENTYYLAVPRPTVTGPPGPYRLSAPTGDGRLVNPSQLRAALLAETA